MGVGGRGYKNWGGVRRGVGRERMIPCAVVLAKRRCCTSQAVSKKVQREDCFQGRELFDSAEANWP